MKDVGSGLVDIVRDFLVVYRLMRSVFERFEMDELRFEDIDELMEDKESSVLFRLKERCHALFRDQGTEIAMRREALLDLAVGSLFHEAMKVRENLYQQEVYAPKIESLRRDVGDESGELFEEFEKILGASKVRLREALMESEVLLAQTRKQLRVVVADNGENGLLMRYLLEKRSLVEDVFDTDLEDLLVEIHGSAADGYTVAAHSYLASAYFGAALTALAAARDSQGRSDLSGLVAYAEGMQAFQNGDYARSLEHLRAWIDAGPAGDEVARATLAHAAVSRIHHLVEGDDRERLVAAATELTTEIGRLANVSLA